MNRGVQARTFFSFPQQQQQVNVVQSATLDTEKNDLISIMAKYLTKKVDKAKTVAQLTTLEVTLSKPS
jgi:hypothetical protein